ncbi:MAG TPA: HNH endonuclease signature motif containing protein, partial [Vicinamibacteria bacterium]|nr:HNH endonuclease signature motif containing protein [Vicinamibacteria bacterium]
VPGCSNPAEHLHHVKWRSRGGTDDGWNLVALCVAHHLAGVHAGYIEIEGHAPDGLTFIVGEEAVRRARVERRQITGA